MDIALSSNFITFDPKLFTKIEDPSYKYYEMNLIKASKIIDETLIKIHYEWLNSLPIVNIKSSLEVDPNTIYQESIKDYNSIKRISPSM